MGAKLVAIYEDVGRDLGFEGRMKLAILTKIPSNKAASTDDSPANMQIFQAAAAQLRTAKAR